MSDSVAAALAEEMRRMQSAEAAGATRAERAEDPTLIAPPQQPEAAPGAAAQAKAMMQTLSALPPQVVTPILVLTLDLIVRRAALWKGGEAARDRYSLTDEERQMLVEVWTPVVALYMPQLNIHPLFAAGGFTTLVYALKSEALSAGGLETLLLGGKGAQPDPRTPEPAPTPPVSTAELMAQQAAQSAPADSVLEKVKAKTEELKTKRGEVEA